MSLTIETRPGHPIAYYQLKIKGDRRLYECKTKKEVMASIRHYLSAFGEENKRGCCFCREQKTHPYKLEHDYKEQPNYTHDPKNKNCDCRACLKEGI